VKRRNACVPVGIAIAVECRDLPRRRASASASRDQRPRHPSAPRGQFIQSSQADLACPVLL